LADTDTEIPQASPRAKAKPWKWLVVAIIAVGAIWYVCENAGRWKDRFVPRKFRVVDAGQIYASGQIDRHLLPGILEDNKIKTIVSLVADDPSDPDVAAEIQLAKDLQIDRHVDSLNGDGTGDIHAYANAVKQIVDATKAQRPVLLHCSSGAQRSNGATFFYRVFIEHWNADDAAREMVTNSFSPRSNPALIPYLNSHMREMGELLVANGSIEKIPDPLPQIDPQRIN
jgi:protein tyrosine/serine phosphatase